MPFTINSIGTGYVGKSNLETRHDVCEFCGAETTISSYDTWHCFVILFVVPVIPLGRKRIIDECASCRRHRVMSLGEWNRVKEEAVHGGLEKVSKNPDDVEAALEAFGTLVAFGRKAEAARMAGTLTGRFGGNPDVQMLLGAWHTEEGREKQGDECFERALEAAPEHKAARRAVALCRMESGQCDAARELLSFMLDPGPDQDPAVLVMLACEYQTRARHQEAMEIFACVLKANPQAGAEEDFRKMVALSEAELGTGITILPGKRRNYLLRAGLPAAVLLVLGTLAGIDVYLRGNQELHVVNGAIAQVRVSVDGGPEIAVAPRTRRQLEVAEGRHRAIVTYAGGDSEKIDFEVANGFGDRWGNDSVFVLNPRGAATLCWTEVVYTVGGLGSGSAPRSRLYFGKRFFTIRDVDYSFEAPPLTINTETQPPPRVHVRLIRETPAEAIGFFPEGTPPGRLLEFAEYHLMISPADEDMLRVYQWLAAYNPSLIERCRNFLVAGLERRPVHIEWHRTYQGLSMGLQHYRVLVTRYEGMLRKEPENSALLYLRGRIEPVGEKALDYFERAIKEDRKNPYPYLGRGYQLHSRGDFAAARRDLSAAARLKPGVPSIRRQLYRARFALGEYAALLKQLRKQQKADPTNLGTHESMLEILVKTGDVAGARKLQEKYAKVVSGRLFRGQDAQEATLGGEVVLLYFLGDNAGVLKRSKSFKNKDSREGWAICAHMSLGNMAQVEKLLPKDKDLTGSDFALMMSAGWRLSGNAAEAEEWFERALGSLTKGSGEDRYVADLLLKKDLAAEEIISLSLEPVDKVVLLVAVASSRPGLRKPLLALARKLNYSLFVPHNFLERAISSLEK